MSTKPISVLPILGRLFKKRKTCSQETKSRLNVYCLRVGACVFVRVSHVFFPCSKRPLEGLAAVVGDHNVLKERNKKDQTTSTYWCPRINVHVLMSPFPFTVAFSLSKLGTFLSGFFELEGWCTLSANGTVILMTIRTLMSFFSLSNTQYFR